MTRRRHGKHAPSPPQACSDHARSRVEPIVTAKPAHPDPRQKSRDRKDGMSSSSAISGPLKPIDATPRSPQRAARRSGWAACSGCLLTYEEDYAYQQPSLTAKKLQLLEVGGRRRQLADIRTVPTTVDEALEAVRADHAFLTPSGVFAYDLDRHLHRVPARAIRPREDPAAPVRVPVCFDG